MTYDTSQVDLDYLNIFDFSMNVTFLLYKNFFQRLKNKTQNIYIHPNKQNDKNLQRMNNLIIKWIYEKDLEISGFIVLKFLKEIILLLMPEKKKNFKKIFLWSNKKCC